MSRVPESSKDVIVQTIKQAKYPVEVHEIYTSDGYKLTLHRMPNNKDNEDKSTGSVTKSVLLVHGLFTSGGQWIAYPKKSLAYKLWDAGYDVWIIHLRGTSYSLGHSVLQISDKKYWDYSWHEFGSYDAPETIDYIIKTTSCKKIHYVGHSQGCSVLLVMLAVKPEYNDKIASACILCPAVLVHLTKGFQRNLFIRQASLFNFLGLNKVRVDNSLLFKFARFFGNFRICSILFSKLAHCISGSDTGQIVNTKYAPMMFKYLLDNISVKQLNHVVQQMNQGKFQMFDYGSKNKEIHGTEIPPEYDLSLTKVPLLVIYGTKDGLTSATMVESLIAKLHTVQRSFFLPFNHFDFIFGSDSEEKVYDPILKFTEQFNEH